MNIYEQVKSKFILPNAFEDWRSYRTQITERILSIALHDLHMSEHKTMAILGAGQCNDINLTECLNYYDYITLIDEDSAAMEEAFQNISQELQNRIIIKHATLDGIISNDIESMCQNILEYVKKRGLFLSKEEYLTYVTEQLMIIKSLLYTNPEQLHSILPPKSYNLIVCLGVHSQLLSGLSYCLEILDYNISQQLYQGTYSGMDIYHRILTDMLNSIIPILNQSIFDSSKGSIMIGCEYDDKHPIAGAYTSILDIRDRIHDHAAPANTNEQYNMTEEHLLWNFHSVNHITYDMLIQTISVTV
ncbi:MAG: hypothetical protein IJ079_07450 [Lachnospiraceae bacterium]|nr:hypothetical protein [Lachnospiraceae bacterium]